jgi:hypothetical protein
VCDLTKYYSGNKIKKKEMVRACSTYVGERRGEYTVLMRKPEGRRQLGKRRSRWEVR